MRSEPEQRVPPAEEADEKPKRLVSKVGLHVCPKFYLFPAAFQSQVYNYPKQTFR